MRLIISILITAIAYLIVPLIFSIIGFISNRRYSPKTVWAIVIINGVCVWSIFQIIRLNAGEEGTGAAVFLWSTVAYWMLRIFESEEPRKEPKKKKEKKYTRQFTAPEPEEEPEEDYQKEPVDPFQNIDNEKRRYKITIRVVSFLLVLSFGLIIYQVSAKSKIEDELEYQVRVQSELENELEKSRQKLKLFDEYVDLIDELEDELEKNQEKIQFFDEFIVFVEDDGTSLYHKYECYRFKGDYFWAYNVEQAIYRGYEPCIICCEE